ncbi:MAG TPA: 5-oxoprolinase subunit PxpB [Pyrinomonadaceae bacterium]|jgi:inhibitor of KinA
MSDKIRFFSLGDNALTVEFGNEISEILNERALKLGQFIEQNAFQGFIEIVPAYASLSIFYNTAAVKRAFPRFATAFEAVRNFAEIALRNLEENFQTNSRVIEIPVSFEPEFTVDLDFVAEHSRLKPDEVIEIFIAKTYRVFMLGFLPGFAYMGEVDARIATPRKLTPRLEVAEGSVGIAGKQTGIYSLSSPGGWQIIGKTAKKLFTPEAENPTFLRAGDSVKFYKI